MEFIVRIILFVMLLIGATISNSALAASFDCAKASTKVEKMICGDIELSARDSTLAIFYKRAMNVSADKEQLKQEQRAWLKAVAKCEDLKCLKTHYYSRINSLADISLNNITPNCNGNNPAASLICSDQGLQQQYMDFIGLYKTRRDLTEGSNKWLVDNSFYRTTDKIFLECHDSDCAVKKFVTVIDFWKDQINEIRIENTHAYMPKWKPKLIASGVEHTCVAGEDFVECWGTAGYENMYSSKKFNGIQQLDESTSCVKDSKGWWCRERNVINEIPDEMKDAEKLVAAEYHICGLKDKKVKCWGDNKYGTIDVPGDLSNVIDIAASLTHTCVVLSEGGVECWGEDSYGEISNARKFKNAVKIHVGFKFTCIENKDGHHQCTNIFNDLDGNQKFSSEQKSFLDNNKFIYFTAKHQRICGITKDKSFACFPEWESKAPNSIMNDHSLYAISFGNGHVCVLSETNGISCWGDYANEDVNMYKFPYDAKRVMLDALKNE
jgi:uncharacterized protein YecT (DUF1311 family)